jgi:hypothetical protein
MARSRLLGGCGEAGLRCGFVSFHGEAEVTRAWQGSGAALLRGGEASFHGGAVAGVFAAEQEAGVVRVELWACAEAEELPSSMAKLLASCHCFEEDVGGCVAGEIGMLLSIFVALLILF